MLKWFKKLDEILRGETTRLPALAEGKIAVPIGGLSVVILLLGAVYGLCIGSYSLIRGGEHASIQLLASAVKVPMLFFLTLLVTLPSLYVFNALIGSCLTASSVLRLLIAGLGVMLAVLSSLGPIVVFFAVSTTSYHFMILLNVIAGTLAGILGLGFLLRTLHRLVIAHQPMPTAPPQPVEKTENLTAPDVTSALDLIGQRTDRKALRVFNIWTIVFALVGAQMSWVLRPFIGRPGAPFEWFRHQESNFFIAVFKSIGSLFN
jgi:hypothetical protein